ncbi:MAG: glutathione-regulated potassium-efflux system protein KefC [Polyangiales bacterium]
MGEHGLLFDAMLYLAAAVIFVSIASRLKLGSVLGYLVAGCAIGPWGLRFVHDVHAILHFAELGVVLMLFLIGLELDPSRLWSMRRSVFGGGSLQLLACGLVLGVATFALGLPWQAAMVAGLALALSSTAIAVQTMRERGLLTSPMGRTSFAVLLFQDIAAIPLIAIVPLLAGKSAGGWIGIGKVLGAILGVVVFGRFLTTPLLRVIARTNLREIFTAFALLLVLGIAQVMSAAGVSMALGAFLAGVLLAGSEYRHALETDIEPFKGLLLGLFFIGVGMSVDFGLAKQKPVLIASLVVGFLVLKVLTLFLLARSIGVPKKQRFLFASVVGQGGEFAFVVFGLAGQTHLLPGRWDAIFTLVVALSMASTPLMMIVSDRLAARGESVDREADTIEDASAPVILAGFGRFGQIVGRLLFASGIRATVLDHDPDQIELLKRFGFRIFYGDATRLDLLQAAGAEQAKLLVVAIDDPPAALRLVELASEHFPNMKIVSRARNVSDYMQLRRRGVQRIERETFESALRAGRHALEVLGLDPYEAREWADRFRLHNVRNLEELLPHMENETRRLSLSRAAREQLEAQFARDREKIDSESGAWTSDSRPPPERLPAS